MDCITKWPDVYAIPNQETSTLTDALVTSFCRFGILRELHSDQGRNFESWLIQVMLEHLVVSMTWITPLHPQSEGMAEQFVKMVEEHLRMVVSMHQSDWDERLPIFLLVYRDPPMRQQARRLPARCSRWSYTCPATCCPELHPTGY
jgi:transposase InsO family protein